MSEKMTETEFLTTLKVVRIRLPRAVEQREQDVAYDSKRGYRPEFCIHGTYQWTDYDNICGGCEDGVTLRQMVVEGALRDVREFRRRLDVTGTAVGVAAREGMPLDQKPLWEWAKEPLSDLD